ncbi:hypothetical protein COU61_02650 [Candidatus Pacearchaeota archaeon CG10_big_fil_rev_8_21_14_0_10_35_13]|nr:MAG: hypothetical protein COU61_02650 [Candidatus Pacearchaeota archaeon CG10_big_fil_rev_8_21_14_0_10_35_13]
MNKNNLFLFSSLLLVLVLSLVSAVDISISDSYRPGETIIGKIDGNFITPLKHDDLTFLDNRKVVPMVYDLFKIDDSYYFYAVLPLVDRNYSLMLKDVRYFDSGFEKRSNILKNFSVQGNISGFSVSPGVVVTNKDFSILVRNYVGKSDVSVTFGDVTNTITLGAGKSEKFYFSIVDVPEFSTLMISSGSSSYEIPVLVLQSSINSSNTPNLTSHGGLRFVPDNLTIELLKNSSAEVSYSLTLENFGVDDLENLEFSIPQSLGNLIKIVPEGVPLINASSSFPLILTVFPLTTTNLTEEILAFSTVSTSSTAVLSIGLRILPVNYSKPLVNTVPLVDPSSGSSLSCLLDLKGSVCYSSEECDGSLVDSREGLCCTAGSCVVVQPSNTAGKWIIILLLTGIAVVAFFIFRKYKSTKKTSADVFRERQNPVIKANT